MMSPIQKQGYIGDISSKSTAELMDLLSRQEKILSKTQFVESLPDKGAKVRVFYEKLQQLLLERTQQADGRHVFPTTGHATSQNQGKSVPTVLKGDNHKQEQETDDSSLHNKPQKSMPLLSEKRVSSSEDEMRLPQQENLVIPTSTSLTTTLPQNESSNEVEMQTNRTGNKSPVHDSDLEASLEKMQISGGEVSVMDRILREKNTNAYSKAIQNATEIHIPPKLNSGLRKTNISDLRREYKFKSRDQGNVPAPVRVAPRVVEESAATPPLYKHKESKLIPLDESLILQKTQKIKQEELQARHAAEKLSQRLCVNMEQYNPEGVDMSYRNQEQEVDSDDELE